jgi:adenine-specific DNA-methyltransferase
MHAMTESTWWLPVLLNRYLGNKSDLIIPLTALVGEYCQPGDAVFDAFSGSLAVSMAFKRCGYRVSANDLNLLSWTFAQAYLVPGDLETSDHLLPRAYARSQKTEVDAQIRQLSATDGYTFLSEPSLAERYRQLLLVLSHLNALSVSGLPSDARRRDFYDAYCPEGRHSAFLSSRGKHGRRRFFTPVNAERLDLMLSQVRLWSHQSLLSPHLEALLLAVICFASEKVANTQGTWHDFPRDEWDSRAFKPLTLVPPALDPVLAGVGGHWHGREADTSEVIDSLPPQRLAYFDPPYNFRQYTAYYHLPNLICRYCEIPDLDQYFEGLKYVRGQNMVDDRPSVFCSAQAFLPAMRDLLLRTPAEVVVVSYFTGKNHWSQFDSDPDGRGLRLLSELMQEAPFKPGTLQVFRVPRTNYASYGGYTARKVDELLIVAQKPCSE